MILIQGLYMYYPIEKRYIDYILKPFSNEKFTALNDINLTINQGDRIAFLGPNGAGKTTFLKLLGGLLYPSKGRVTINGYDIIKQNLMARKDVGFVLNEERSFYWRLTGRENMEFFGNLDNIFGKQLDTKISHLLNLVGLNGSGNKKVASYSSGMKQRLAIARGLMTDPEILILDEPTRTIDPISAEEIRTIIMKKIHEKKKRTLLIATHSLEEAKYFCNKICIMNKGTVLLYKTVDEILSKYKNLSECYVAYLKQKQHLTY